MFDVGDTAELKQLCRERGIELILQCVLAVGARSDSAQAAARRCRCAALRARRRPLAARSACSRTGASDGCGWSCCDRGCSRGGPRCGRRRRALTSMYFARCICCATAVVWLSDFCLQSARLPTPTHFAARLRRDRVRRVGTTRLASLSHSEALRRQCHLCAWRPRFGGAARRVVSFCGRRTSRAMRLPFASASSCR